MDRIGTICDPLTTLEDNNRTRHGLAVRATLAARQARETDPDTFDHRHTDWPQWTRRATMAHAITTALNVPVDTVAVTDDPDWRYGLVDPMSTTADFYDGRGSHARWLGSLQHDADPAGVLAAPPGRLALAATDHASFADAVEDLLFVWEDHTSIGNAFPPDDGWPWAWPDSAMTDWVYAFDNGHVWARGDQGWIALDPPAPDPLAAITTGIRTPGTRG